MRTERNKILHELQRKVKIERENNLKAKINELNNLYGDAKMYKSVKMLNKKNFEYPSVHDDEGKSISNPQSIHDTIKTHFQKHFNNSDHQNIEINEHELHIPISEEEVSTSISRLNNNRASGFDRISAEMLKNSPAILIQIITFVLNINP